MVLLNICSNPEILEIMRIVKIVINVIFISTPILLIVMLSLDLFKAVSSGDDSSISKITKQIPTRFIAACVIFFVPTFVKLVVRISSTQSNDYYACIENATSDNIKQAYVDVADEYIKKAEDTLAYNAYNSAVSAVSKIKDSSIKNDYLNKLNELEKYINIKMKIDELINKYNKTEYVNLYKQIEDIKDENIKNKLLTYAESIKGQKPMDVASGTFKKKFNGSKDWLYYYEYIPNNPTTNMPIVIFLHGDGEVNNIDSIKDLGFIYGSKKVYGNDFPYIVLQPNTRVYDWTRDSIMSTVKELIDYTCEEYLCDTDHIIITGMSRGAIGTWAIANKYKDYFSAAVPVSCGGSIDGKNFINLPVRSFVGGNSDDYNTYYNSMKKNVDKINNAGGNASLEVISGGSHGNTFHKVYSRKDVIEWMLEQ